jgi:hypothetical protein
VTAIQTAGLGYLLLGGFLLGGAISLGRNHRVWATVVGVLAALAIVAAVLRFV